MKTQFDPKIHHRRSIRLKGYDYSQAGIYFVTMVTKGRKNLFGEVLDGEMRLNECGEIIAETWQWLAIQYPYIELGAWIVMPNHFHGILIIDDSCWGGSRTAPTGMKRKTLGRLIGAFKTVSTKKMNILRHSEGSILWQRDFYDRIIRNQQELELTWRYIESNPARWKTDNDNPAGG
jgi:putative transposase